MLRRRTTRAAVALLALATACARGTGDESDGAAAEAKAHEVAALDPGVTAHLPPGGSVEAADEGRKLFITCAVCHGLDAGGTQLGPSLRDDRWAQGSGSLEEIERVIREGVPQPKEFQTPMPALGGGAFDSAQVRALATYVYAVGHGGAPATVPAARAP